MPALFPCDISALDFTKLGKNVCVPHPTTLALDYGYIAPYQSRNLTLPGGEIFLRVGRHFGFSNGFGVNHIWQGHGHELPQMGFPTIQHVPAFVAAVLHEGAQVLCEGYQTREGYRLTVVRGERGCVILSPQISSDGVDIYSVVTAYKLPRRQRAMQVGTLHTKKAP